MGMPMGGMVDPNAGGVITPGAGTGATPMPEQATPGAGVVAGGTGEGMRGTLGASPMSRLAPGIPGKNGGPGGMVMSFVEEAKKRRRQEENEMEKKFREQVVRRRYGARHYMAEIR